MTQDAKQNQFPFTLYPFPFTLPSSPPIHNTSRIHYLQNAKPKKYALIIPESRTRPREKCRLVKKIDKLLTEEGIRGQFDIYFVTIEDGLIAAGEIPPTVRWKRPKKSIVRKPEPYRPGTRVQNTTRHELYLLLTLPPKRFPSGRSWISKAKRESMAQRYVPELKRIAAEYACIFVYARGSYLLALQLAVEFSGVTVLELLSHYHLSVLKKAGLLWMKVGLCMPIALRCCRESLMYYLGRQENDQGSFPF
jgi:hypothetical protein